MQIPYRNPPLNTAKLSGIRCQVRTRSRSDTKEKNASAMEILYQTPPPLRRWNIRKSIVKDARVGV